MKKAIKSRNASQRYTMLLVMAAFALVGVGALAASHAKNVVAETATGRASVAGISSCVDSAWTVNVSAISNVAVLQPVDIVHTTSNPSGFNVLASNVYLNRTTPYAFQYSPQAGTRTDSLYVVPHGETPTHEATMATSSVTNPCI